MPPSPSPHPAASPPPPTTAPQEQLGQRSDHERKIAGEIRARVTELKTLDPKVAADYGAFGGGGGGGGAGTPGKAHRPDNVSASNFLHHTSD